MTTRIFGGKIVDEGEIRQGTVVIEDDLIAETTQDYDATRGNYDNEVDATGCFVLPGIIDTHVHFREPGMIDKADIESESRAAAYGGVTSYIEMPNTVPPTTTLERWNEKLRLAREKSHVNYSFFFGATNSNADIIRQLDASAVPGVKLFMGSSTGNMLVDRREALESVFKATAEAGLPLVTHCEDTALANENMRQAKARFGDDPPISLHETIRSAETCYKSTQLAVSMAQAFGTQLHVAHVSTARELSLFGASDSITAEAVLAHLWFTNRDYERLGALIKCNPSVKTEADREALRKALTDGTIATVATDHAPHLLNEKQGGASKALSGMPMVQFSLPTMLELVSQGVITLERMVELMCHNPARLFRIAGRGFIRKGYKADLVVVRPDSPWILTSDLIMNKCGWSPLLGQQFSWAVERTFCNGQLIYDRGKFDPKSRGQQLKFNRE